MSDFEVGEIKESIFSLLKANIGGGLNINRENTNIKLVFCHFDQCIATSRASSSSRESVPSGGGLFFDITSVNISKTIFTRCKSEGYGQSAYINCF